MAEPNIPPGFDLTDPDLYSRRVPMEEFAELRRAAPVWWHPQPRGTGGFDDEGYWAVTRHAEVVAVSRDSDHYSSWENTAIIRHQEGATRDQIELQRFVLLNIDPPQHTQLRGIVSRGFTPRAINDLRSTLSERAGQIMRTALESGSGDFVTDVAAELPLQAIAELIGIPQDDRRKVFDWSNDMVGYDDPEYTPTRPRPRPSSSATRWRWPRTAGSPPGTTSSPSSSTLTSTAASFRRTSSASS